MRRDTKSSKTWRSYHVVTRGADGTLESGETPFLDELGSGDGDPTETAINKMRLLQAHGMPEATWCIKNSKGKALVDRADDKEPAIWILKCWPGCWRLYFYVHRVSDDDNRIVYLHAKCKKKQQRDSADSIYARRLYNGIGPGGSGHAPLALQGSAPLSIRSISAGPGQ